MPRIPAPTTPPAEIVVRCLARKVRLNESENFAAIPIITVSSALDQVAAGCRI